MNNNQVGVTSGGEPQSSDGDDGDGVYRDRDDCDVNCIGLDVNKN